MSCPSSATVIAPCRNAEALIGPTVESLIARSVVRSGRLTLQYLWSVTGDPRG